MAPRILIFSIAMGADYSFYVKTIETHARTFLPLNISAIGTVLSFHYIKEKLIHKLFEIFKILPIRKRIASAETMRGNMVDIFRILCVL